MHPTRKDFLQFAKHAPGLLELEASVKAHARANRRTRDYCANAVWYKEYRPQIYELVGWESRNPHLKSSEAFEVAYRYLYHLLPDCNHNCMCWG